MASIGAIIVVLSMAMDPFTQQILSFPTARTNLTNSTAHIGSAQGFGLVYYLGDSKDGRCSHLFLDIRIWIHTRLLS